MNLFLSWRNRKYGWPGRHKRKIQEQVWNRWRIFREFLGKCSLRNRDTSKWATVDISEHKAFKANEKAAFTISTKLSTLGVMGHIMSDQTQVCMAILKFYDKFFLACKLGYIGKSCQSPS